MSTPAPTMISASPLPPHSPATPVPAQLAAPQARVPADVEREDRLLAGLTARQVLIVVAAGLVAYAGWWGCRAWLPLTAYAPFGLALVAVGFVVAVGRRDGVSLDRWLLAAARQRLGPARLVAAPGGVDPLPDWVAPIGEGLPAPLRLPAHAVRSGGVIDLGAEGLAQVCQASPVNLALRSPEEQQTLLDAFAQFLHAMSGPVQVLIRSRQVDTTAMAASIHRHAAALDSPRLQAAARQHAAFVAELAGRHDLLDRRTFLILRQPAGPQAGERLARRVQDAVTTLTACQVDLTVLDAAAAWSLLASVCDPNRSATGTAAALHLAATEDADAEDAGGRGDRLGGEPVARAMPGVPIRFEERGE